MDSDWQLQLIMLYLAVCKHWQEGGWAQVQRYAPFADLSFTDEEVVTISPFKVTKQPQVTAWPSRHAVHLWMRCAVQP